MSLGRDKPGSTEIPLYAVSDLHFFAEMGSEPQLADGLVFESYPIEFLRHWKETIEPEAWILVPGDVSDSIEEFCVRADYGVLETMPGRKLVSPGNHDGMLPWSQPAEVPSFFERFPGLVPLDGTAHRLALKTGAPGLVVAGLRGACSPDDEWFGEEPVGYGPENPHERYRHELEQLNSALGAAKVLQAHPEDRLAIQVHYPPFEPHGHATEMTELIEGSGADLCVYGHLHAEHNALAYTGRLSKGGPHYQLVSASALDMDLLHLGTLGLDGAEWSF